VCSVFFVVVCLFKREVPQAASFPFLSHFNREIHATKQGLKKSSAVHIHTSDFLNGRGP